nr:Tn3 family transposase [Azospirillum sp. B510]
MISGRYNYREGQEDQLGALGLVVNAIILWNTIYMDCIFRRKAPSGNGGKRPGRTVKAPSRFGEFAHP